MNRHERHGLAIDKVFFSIEFRTGKDISTFSNRLVIENLLNVCLLYTIAIVTLNHQFVVASGQCVFTLIGPEVLIVVEVRGVV